LTIDDSPTDFTEEILDVLKDHNVRATFFVISSLIEGRQDVMDRIIAEGHEIANHLKYDEPSWLLSTQVFESQLLEWEEIVKPWILTGQEAHYCKWFRPGQGVLTSSMTAILKKHG
jgi:peptidoglycan/xylan/chitin deacetylase (PgdA/CDA1 family)